jgi:AP endonuclease-1
MPMVLETPTEEVWTKEIEILQRMADPATAEEDLDLEGMVEEIRAEVKKHSKDDAKKTTEKKKVKGAKEGKGKKSSKKKVDEDEDDDDEDD